MFLSKNKGAKPEGARSELEGVAAVHGGTAQKVLAILVAVGTAFAICAGVAVKYVIPSSTDKKAAAEPAPKAPEVKPAAEIKVPLDLDRAVSGPSAGASYAGASSAAASESDYQPLPGLAGDSRPSPAPSARTSPDRRIGSPAAGGGAQLPPGMAEQNAAAARAQSPASYSGQGSSPDSNKIPDRKMAGDLGDFGDAPAARLSTAPRTAGRNSECAGIYGGPEAEAECNRRVPASAPVAPAMPAPVAAPAGPQNGNALSSQLIGIQTPNGGVGVIPHPHLTLAKGEPITCTLTTAIRTEQAGFVECVTDYPIYSMDGKVLLAERGTRINGEWSRDVAPGSRSIFILWTRAFTPAPHFVTFDLFSPGSDRLGRAGIEGDVDNKYWERYSGPLMFSLLQDVSAVAAAKAAGTPTAAGGSVFVLPSTQSTGQNAVAELLKQGSEVKRSLYRNQGDTISITVARFIDFSPVYKLRSARGNN